MGQWLIKDLIHAQPVQATQTRLFNTPKPKVQCIYFFYNAKFLGSICMYLKVKIIKKKK